MTKVFKMIVYNYYDDSYRLNRVTGTIALDSARNASRTNNFVYDASGRMVADSSKKLSVEYDPYGMPVPFGQTLGMAELTSESPTYYTNSLEMDAYFMGYLRNNGHINVYGEGLEDASEDEVQQWSKDFYQYYLNEREGSKDYKRQIIEKFGENWVWRKDWWMEY